MLGILATAKAQLPDSVQVNSTYYRTFTEDDIFNHTTIKYRPLDTVITDFHVFNPVVRRYNINTTLGNLGSPYRNPVGLPYRGLGFDIGMHQLDAWENNKQSALFYRSRAPFIEVSYINGSKKEQWFTINLNQNITKGWNLGLKFERLNSVGFYQRQQANNTNWFVYSSYESKNKRYHLAFSGARNNLLAKLNGGLANVDQFKNNEESNRQLLDVNLSGANNTWRTRYAHVQQAYDLTNRSKKANAGADSLATLANDTLKKERNTTLRLYHVFDLASNALMYNDTAFAIDSFYTGPLFDTLATHDNTGYTIIENRLGVKLMSEKKGFEPLVLDVFAGHQYLHWNSNTHGQTVEQNIDGKSNNVYVGGNIRIPAFKDWSFNGSATVFLLGYNLGDYEGRFSISRTSADTAGNLRNRVEAGIILKAYEPTYIQSRYTSNYFVWGNNFNKTFANTLFANYNNSRYKFDAMVWAADMRQYIYFNEQALPQQASKGVTVFGAQVSKRFLVGKKWHFDDYITAQYTTSALLPLPNLIFRQSMYFQSHVFKKALLLATGFDVFFNTAYKAPNYMPATGQFYIQNQVKVGNYPYVDFFIDAQIKKARIFFKIEHVTSGLFGHTYLQYPNYAMNDRAFKLGINWRFFN